MRIVACLAICMAQPVFSAPQFENLSAALPEHAYVGDWNFFVGGGVAVFDCNADALPDIFVAGGENPAKLIVNKGSFVFEQKPVGSLTKVTGAYPINIDGDDYVDLFVLRAGRNIALKGGEDCTFTDATDIWGLPQSDSWSTAFTAWWEEGGNRPVMAVGNYVDRDNPNGPFEACDANQILRPGSGEYSSHLLEPGFCPLSMLAARDARNRVSLRISNDRHYYVKNGYEQLWDIPEKRFLGIEDGWQRVSLWGMGIASRDLTGDGRDEVMLTSMGDQLLQLAQDDGNYKPAPFAIGTYAQRPHTGGDGRPSTGWHAEFGDVDNDGRADLFIAKGNVDQMPGMATRDPNNLLMQNADGTFTEHAETAGIATFERSRGGALADFDNDGRLDLIVTNRRAALELYRNVTENVGNWVRVALSAPGGNKDAIGAVITFEGGGLTQTQQHVIGGGHAGGQLLPRHFGLGQATKGTVTVEWPDGTKSRTEVKGGETVVIRKP